jgi:hypothetical protein
LSAVSLIWILSVGGGGIPGLDPDDGDAEPADPPPRHPDSNGTQQLRIATEITGHLARMTT